MVRSSSRTNPAAVGIGPQSAPRWGTDTASEGDEVVGGAPTPFDEEEGRVVAGVPAPFLLQGVGEGAHHSSHAFFIPCDACDAVHAGEEPFLAELFSSGFVLLD